MSNISALRAAQARDFEANRSKKIGQAQELHDKGYSAAAIARKMNLPESSVRVLLREGK